MSVPAPWSYPTEMYIGGAYRGFAAGNPEPLTIEKAARISTAARTGRIEDLRDT